RHRHAMADLVGVPLEIVGPERVAELHPLVDTRGLLGAAYLPTDGHVDPTGLTNAFARGAGAGGAEILRAARVTETERGRAAWLLRPSRGDVRAEIVVNAAGMWAPHVGRLVGAELPIVPLQHHYLVTEAIPELDGHDGELPVLRDADGSYYVRQEGPG